MDEGPQSQDFCPEVLGCHGSWTGSICQELSLLGGHNFQDLAPRRAA